LAKSHKQKGNRGEIEWKDFLIANGFEATRKKDGLVDVESNILDIHWEVKRRESLKEVRKWIAQAERDAENLGRNGIVTFRQNFNPWRCIVPAGFLMELLKIREWAVRNGYPH
jgi:hypothetical protein